MAAADLVIDADGVSKRFLLHHNRATTLKERALGLVVPSLRERVESFWALRDISLTVGRGESIGLVGHNGSGKSTFLKLLSGIYLPTGGRLRLRRGLRIGSMIELGTGFNPELSGRENVFLNASILGLTRDEIEARYDSIAAFAELRQFMDQPLKNYSSGMTLRLGFAVAAHLDPQVLLLDEIFAVGDEAFQRKCIARMREFRERGTTILFVSHSPEAIRANCQRVCVLDEGRLVYDGGVETGLAAYRRRPTPAARARQPDAGAAAAAGPDEPTAGADLGRQRFDFLRSGGLEPGHVVLDLGCGDLLAGRHLIPYLDDGHYWGVDHDRLRVERALWGELAPRGIDPHRARFLFSERLALDGLTAAPDLAVAFDLFTELPLNAMARCVATVAARLAPGGRFVVAYFEDPDPESFDPVVQAGGVTTYPDQPPFHYDFATLARLGESRGLEVERLGACGLPDGKVLLVMRRPAHRE